MNPAIISLVASILATVLENGPSFVQEVKDLVSGSGIANTDELIARIEAAQAKWPQWT